MGEPYGSEQGSGNRLQLCPNFHDSSRPLLPARSTRADLHLHTNLRFAEDGRTHIANDSNRIEGCNRSKGLSGRHGLARAAIYHADNAIYGRFQQDRA